MDEVARPVAGSEARAVDVEADGAIGQDFELPIFEFDEAAFVETPFDQTDGLAGFDMVAFFVFGGDAEKVRTGASAADAHAFADFDQSVIGGADGDGQVGVRVF